MFWATVAASGLLNAGIRTFETRAYAVGELSLCAPFLAFDPVMQLLVGALVVPAAGLVLGFRCEEAASFTARHAFAVLSIAHGMLSLSLAGSQAKAPGRGLAGDGAGAGAGAAGGIRLPRGAGLIILNCVLYAFTYRLDAAACRVSGSGPYFACCRLLMAAACLGSSLAGIGRSGGGLGASRFSPFLRPQVALCMLAVVAVDGFYMLSMYRAVSLVSPVFVSAVKRGGGVIVSAALGAAVFGERLAGRWVPLLTVAAGVTLLCL